MLIAVIISLVAGAFVTSFIEYKLNYNLVDLIKDKLQGLERKVLMLPSDVNTALTQAFKNGMSLGQKAVTSVEKAV